MVLVVARGGSVAVEVPGFGSATGSVVMAGCRVVAGEAGSASL